MNRSVSSYHEDKGYRSWLICDNPSCNAGRGWRGVTQGTGLLPLLPTCNILQCLKAIWVCSVLQLQLTLSMIPAFRNPAVRGFFERFCSSLATPFFRTTHRVLMLQGMPSTEMAHVGICLPGPVYGASYPLFNALKRFVFSFHV